MNEYQALTAKRTMTREEAVEEYLGEFADECDGWHRPPARTPWILRDEDTGELIAAYAPTPGDDASLRTAVRNIEWSATARTQQNFTNRSRTFGFSPRLTVRAKEGCSASTMAVQQAAIHAVLTERARLLDDLLREATPREAEDVYTTPVLPDWRLGGTGWTSGNVNYNARLPYHVDGANFPVLSAMPTIRYGVRGGDLAIPEYRTVLTVRDRWTLMFNGRNLVHGITPFDYTTPDAYRITIVYYCLKQMKNCAEWATESALAKRRRTIIEARRDRTTIRGT